MKKALISVLLAVLLSGCLFGCGREAVSEDPAPEPTVEMTATSRTGDRVRLAFADTPLANEPLVVYAKMKSSEARSVLLQAKSVEAEIYYVYAMGHLDGTYRDPAKAVQRADERLGVVLNRSQQYVWERGNKKEQVMLNPDDIPEIFHTRAHE